MTLGRLKLFLALALGVGVLALVLMHFDLGLVRQALARMGLGGLALVIAAGLAAELVLAAGIIPLLPRPMPLAIVFAARQLRDSSSDVLPITQLGGIAFAARALVLAGLGALEASASVIADLTTETFAQGLYVLAGVVASLSLLHRNALLSPWTGAMLGGALFLSIGSLLFAVLQLNGSRWAERLGGKLLSSTASSTAGHAHDFSAAVHAIYRARARVALSILLQFAGWIASGLWLWVVLAVMGVAPDLWSAIAIQALVEGLRSATVFIPAAIGVQEAGYAAVAPVFGLPPEIGLAVSLVRRARDILVAVPVLLLWQFLEGRRAARG
ncbi:MAG TPA: lysylphosphatidylglycerol synthase domain-containing protein [Rhizomicrobium sp.]|jgi:putative membrane protein|nr:lysylphosphatidylglycerol synthase domain-containing protein [Rhizomicrobium sp.]